MSDNRVHAYCAECCTDLCNLWAARGQGRAGPNRSKATFWVQNFKYSSFRNKNIWAWMGMYLVWSQWNGPSRAGLNDSGSCRGLLLIHDPCDSLSYYLIIWANSLSAQGSISHVDWSSAIIIRCRQAEWRGRSTSVRSIDGLNNNNNNNNNNIRRKRLTAGLNKLNRKIYKVKVLSLRLKVSK